MKSKTSRQEAHTENGSTKQIVALSPQDKAQKLDACVTKAASDESWQELQQHLAAIKEAWLRPEPHILHAGRDKFLYFILGFSLFFSICYIFILCFSLFMVVALESFRNFSFQFLGISSAILVINAALIAYAISGIRFQKRCQQYCMILQYRNMEFLKVLAAYTGHDLSIVKKDFSRIIRTGLIPEGHFIGDGEVFTVSDKTQEVPPQESPSTPPSAQENLSSAVGVFLAECTGKTGLSQMHEIISEELMSQIQDVLTQYGYEIYAHPENKEIASPILEIYMHCVDVILHVYPADLRCEKELDADQLQAMHLTNDLFRSILCELCQTK